MLTVTALLLLTAPPQTVLVFDLATEGIDDPSLGAAAASQIATAIAAHGWSAATTHDLGQRVAVEAQKELLGCQANAACIAKLTEDTAVDRVVSGTIGRVGASYLISLSLVAPKEADPKARAGVTFAGLDQLGDAIARVVVELFHFGEAAARPRFVLPEGKKYSFLVLDLTAAGVSEDAARSLTLVLSKEIKAIEGAQVVTRDDVIALLGYEKMKSVLKDCDTSCIVEIGNALATDYVVLGQVGKLADTYLVSLTLVDQKLTDVGSSYRVSESYRGPEDQLIRAVAYASRRLLGLDDQGAGPGAVQVATSVPSVEAYVDNLAVGLLPMPPVRAVSPGRHSVRLSKPGYFDWQSEIYVSPGETTAVWAELSEEPERWYQKWWVWTLVGAAVAGGATAAIVASQASPDNGSVLVRVDP